MRERCFNCYGDLRRHHRHHHHHPQFTAGWVTSHQTDERGHPATASTLERGQTHTHSMETHEGSTLIKPPPKDPNKAPIENVLEVTEMAVLGPVRNAPQQFKPIHHS